MPNDISLERIERALLIAANLCDTYGECMRPLLDSMERDYISAKKRGTETDRIKKLIAGFNRASR